MLVTLQFAVLIGLMIVAGVVWQQREFAMTEALRFNADQMLIIQSECRSALIDALPPPARRAASRLLRPQSAGPAGAPGECESPREGERAARRVPGVWRSRGISDSGDRGHAASSDDTPEARASTDRHQRVSRCVRSGSGLPRTRSVRR